MKTILLRPAVAMIELIFAIVIMGIVMMSAPMLISTAVQSTNVALQQEGINEALSRVNMVMTHVWDEKDTNSSCIPPVLHVTNGDPELDLIANNRRIGVPLSSNSRTFSCGSRNDLNASALGSDSDDTIKDDIDDFTNTTLVDIADAGGGKDYLEQGTVNIATSINYISDTATYSASSFTYVPSAGIATTNIKEIAVVITSTSSATELSKNIILRSFFCNIGGREFERKVIP